MSILDFLNDLKNWQWDKHSFYLISRDEAISLWKYLKGRGFDFDKKSLPGTTWDEWTTDQCVAYVIDEMRCWSWSLSPSYALSKDSADAFLSYFSGD